MDYVQLGNTGYRVSRLGLGAMRLPMIEIGDTSYVDIERATEVIHRALELGINYIDTGFLYCNEEAELVVASALEQWPERDKVVVTAKCTKLRLGNDMEQKGYLRRMLEHQLWKLRRDYFDFYLFHGIGWDNWHDIDRRTGWIKDMLQAKDEGLVKHIGFSFHDTPENMIRLIDEGIFELVTCQYNYLDRANEEAIHYAHEKGLGVVIMGPVGGGRLSVFPKGIRDLKNLSASGAAELALRFVISHPGVHVALSGMSTVEMVEENCQAISKGPLSEEERRTITAMMEQNKKLADLYCTGCQYCMPCPNNVNIPRAFELYNYYKVYGLEEYAITQYKELIKRGNDASQCVECGVCLERCPQHIDIPRQLKEVAALFSQVEE
ncbi:MAG: aldo/keto reductase [Anaerolineae bacterium]|nr:aldo/keto reductase [Anaerolineae bacterium]